MSLVFGFIQKQLRKNVMVNSKIYDVTNWTTNDYNTHIPNISRNKENQAMKFGQLKEHNLRTIFLEKSYTKCGREAGFRPFCKKSKLNISLDE